MRSQSKSLLVFSLLVFSFLQRSSAVAQYDASLPIIYRHNHHLFELQPYEYKHWQSVQDKWLANGKEIKPPAELRVDGDSVPPLPEGIEKVSVIDWDKNAIRETIKEKVSSKLNREPGSVTIKQTESGVLFEGLGLPGRKVNLDQAVELTIAALENAVTDIILPVIETQPELNIDKSLRKLGIIEVVTVGESDYTGSPYARRHNIQTGLDKFNGTLIDQGALFSFNEVLGPVNRSTGYKEELVIKKETTLPDYGGGLCQISTTAYRGVWEYGFPIEKRRNHSFAVVYYSPQGTDATIFPPWTDMQFVNDSPGALLIQTHNDPENSRAYYIYYGTRDGRQSEIIGPYVWGRYDPPEDRIEYTTDIPPGEERKAQGRVPGLKAMWYRVVQKGGAEDIESFYSAYEARPNVTQIGVGNEVPSWIGE